MKPYTKSDAGCYADSTYGHNHVREALADMVEECGASELAERLRRGMSDDASEEYEALDLLNTYCLDCYFDFDNGDLMLYPETEQ